MRVSDLTRARACNLGAKIRAIDALVRALLCCVLLDVLNEEKGQLETSELNTFGEDVSHAQVARRETDHRRLVQLSGDGAGQRKQTCQLVELGVLLLSASARRVLRLLFHGFLFASIELCNISR